MYEQPLYECPNHEGYETVQHDPHVHLRQYGEKKRGRHSARRGENTAFGVSGIYVQAHGQTETHRRKSKQLKFMLVSAGNKKMKP
jgi:hypothetical protein